MPVRWLQAVLLRMVEDDRLGEQALVKNILELLHDADKLRDMGAASRKLAYPDAARQLAMRIIGLAKKL